MVNEIDLNLVDLPKNKLQHIRDDGHDHFYYNEIEIENSPVNRPYVYKENWVTLQITYDTDGYVSDVIIV